MKRTFKLWWSTILPRSLKRTSTSHFKQMDTKRPRHSVLEIQVLAWGGQKTNTSIRSSKTCEYVQPIRVNNFNQYVWIRSTNTCEYVQPILVNMFNQYLWICSTITRDMNTFNQYLWIRSTNTFEYFQARRVNMFNQYLWIRSTNACEYVPPILVNTLNQYLPIVALHFIGTFFVCYLCILLTDLIKLLRNKNVTAVPMIVPDIQHFVKSQFLSAGHIIKVLAQYPDKFNRTFSKVSWISGK